MNQVKFLLKLLNFLDTEFGIKPDELIDSNIDVESLTALMFRLIENLNDGTREQISSYLNARSSKSLFFDHLFYEASCHNFTYAVSLLLKLGINVNNVLTSTPSSLMIAVKMGHMDMVKLLVNAGANVNSMSLQGMYRYSPLHLAAQYGYISIAELLINAGADVNTIASNTYTPLYCAALNGHHNIAQLLINAGAKLDTAISLKEIIADDDNGYTPIAIATRNGHGNIVKLLINAGAQLNRPTKYYGQPLVIADHFKKQDIFASLLHYGAGIGANLTDINQHIDYADVVLIGAKDDNILVTPQSHPKAITTIELFQQNLHKFSLKQLQIFYKTYLTAKYWSELRAFGVLLDKTIYLRRQEKQLFVNAAITLCQGYRPEQQSILRVLPFELFLMILCHLNKSSHPIDKAACLALIYDNITLHVWEKEFSGKNFTTFEYFWSTLPATDSQKTEKDNLMRSTQSIRIFKPWNEDFTSKKLARLYQETNSPQL